MSPPETSVPAAGSAAPVDSGFERLTRRQWAGLGGRPETSLTEGETTRLAATGEPVRADEVADIYLPLAQLISELAAAKRLTQQTVSAFLGRDPERSPFIIGLAGSVAVGKSTTARVLQALLRERDGPGEVELLTTDGFLLPNAVLEARGLMTRKGFPESYDQRALIAALSALRSGMGEVATPVYSHLAYDIVPDEFQVFRQPEVVIVEGLNVLQVNTRSAPPEQVVVSDFFDFSIYVDAAEDDVAQWFSDRLLALRTTVLRQPESYFHRFAALSDQEVTAFADQIWRDINLVNWRENVAPTRSRANLILRKGPDHRVELVFLRRM